MICLPNPSVSNTKYINVFRITNNNSEQYEVSSYSYEDDDDYDDEWSDDSEWSDDDDQNKTVSLCCFFTSD